MKMDREIDAALKMLGHSQPPTGLIARVHRSLAVTAACSPARKGWLVWVPAAGAVMATILFALTLQMHSTPGKKASAIQTAKIASMDSAVSGPYRPALVPAESLPKRNVSMPTVPRNSHARKRVQYRHAANLMSYPLTRQEKLLVQFVQHAKPEDLRDLNPEYQAKVEAQQEAEFDAYLNSGSSSSTQGTTEIATANPSTQE
ncbi:MAG: hypothetical protein ACYDC6_13185 [Acidobacteriaceae bacterium]